MKVCKDLCKNIFLIKMLVFKSVVDHNFTLGDIIFKKDLIGKIMVLSERFAPNYEWFFMTMNTVFLFGGDNIEQVYLSNVLKLLTEGYKLESQLMGDFYTQTYLEMSKRPNLPDILIKVRK